MSGGEQDYASIHLHSVLTPPPVGSGPALSNLRHAAALLPLIITGRSRVMGLLNVVVEVNLKVPSLEP